MYPEGLAWDLDLDQFKSLPGFLCHSNPVQYTAFAYGAATYLDASAALDRPSRAAEGFAICPRL